MAIEIKESDGGIGFRIVVRGSLSGKEFVELIRNHFTEDKAKFRKNRYSITDLTKVTGTDVTSEQVQTLKEMGKDVASRVNPDRVVAIVASTDFSFGMSRMLQMLAANVPWDIQVFRNQAEAEDWVRARVKDRFGIESLTLQPDECPTRGEAEDRE